MNFFSLLIFIIFIVFSNSELDAKIEIRYKVGNEIITNIDVSNEKDYLTFLRPNLNNLANNELLKISEDSLIRDLIKKKEINSVFKDVNNKKIIKEIEKTLFRFKNVKTKSEFLNLLKDTNIEYEKIVEKMKYEALWNELIFQKYNSLIKIDENKLRLELKAKISNNIKFEYNISELLFEVEKNENLNNKYEEILNFIKLNDFKTAASKYSIANSANIGGEIGWIKETLLSKNLNSLIGNLKKSEITNPIKYPTGYLLIKLNGKKEIKQSINLDKELKELINFEKNKQLNQFSLLFYKKLKQNTKINEY